MFDELNEIIKKKLIFLGVTPIEVINTDDDLENKFCQCSDQIGFPILCSCQFGNKVQTKSDLVQIVLERSKICNLD